MSTFQPSTPTTPTGLTNNQSINGGNVYFTHPDTGARTLLGPTGQSYADPTFNSTATSNIAPSTLPSTLNSSNLSGSNPVVVPSTTPTYTSTPSVTNPYGTTVGTNGLATPPQTNSTQDLIKSQLSGLGGQLGTEAQVTQDLQNQFQLAQKTQQATTDYNAYAQAKLNLQQKLDNVYNQPGISGDAASQTVSEFSRIGNANLANLAIVAQASQGLLGAAQQTIKDKLAAQFQPIQDQIDFLTKFAGVNNKDLTDKEQFQLQYQADQKKVGLANITKTADDLHQNLLQNGAPQSIYSTLDQIANDFVAGKITASDAQSKMYQAAGDYGKTTAYSVVTNPITGAQTAFNTKTGEFLGGGPSIGNPGASSVPQVSPTEIKDGVPLTAAAATSLGGVYPTAWDTVNGLKAPSQTTGRSPAFINALTTAQDKISQALFGHNFDAIAAETAYKFRTSETYQKYTANAPIAISTITEIANLSKALKLQGIDAFNNIKVSATASGLNPFASTEDRSNAKKLQSLLAVSADDIGLLLGAGSGSDFKTKLGGVIFGADGNVRTTQDLAQAIQERIQSKLTDYYQKAGVKDASQYAKLDVVGSTNTPQAKDGDTKLYNGITYKVVNGVWTPQ